MMNLFGQPPLYALPSLKTTPFILVEGLVGYAYGTVIRVNPIVTASIFAIRSFAEHLFFFLANVLMDGKDLRSHKIGIVTSTGVNMTFLIVMREMNLIDRLSSCIFGGVIVATLAYRVSKIQKLEEQAKADNEILDPDATPKTGS